MSAPPSFCTIFFFFFFFQAEDGIRDLIVTGVQTCALPISAISPLAHGAVAQGLELHKTNVRRSDPSARGQAMDRQGQLFSPGRRPGRRYGRSEEHTSELQSRSDLVCRLLLEKKKEQ